MTYAGEVCDGLDNDLDGQVDESLPVYACTDGTQLPSCIGGVPQLCACPAATGSACDNGKLGACRVTGTLACNDDHLGTTCKLATDAGPAPGVETCKGIDDDCDGVVDVSAGGIHVCDPDADVAETPDAGVAETPDAGAVEDAGAADAGDDVFVGANVDGCSCRAEGHGGAAGPLALAGIGLAVFLGRRRRR